MRTSDFHLVPCRVFEARSRNRAAPSQLQDRVVSAFRELGCGVEVEHIDKVSGYSIDIIVTVPGEWRVGGGRDLRCAVEVTAPSPIARSRLRCPDAWFDLIRFDQD